MKKTISFVLAVIMTVTCFTGVLTVSAEEGSKIDEIINDVTNMENFQDSIIAGSSGFTYPEDAEYDIAEMIENGEIEGEMLGISIDYLYNSTTPLYWNNVSVSKNDLALAVGNVNSYLQRILKNKFGGFNLYSMEKNKAGVPYASHYATVMANFLGNLFYPDFKEVTVSFEGTETVNEDVFYGEIVKQSGFGALLEANWCNQGDFDFRPLMETWGLLRDKVLKSEYRDGYILGRKLVAAVVNKFLSEGPVNAMLSILQIYSRSYKTYLYDATAALFTLKLAAGEVELTELESLHELFNLVFNGNDPEATDKLQFVQMPTDRFRMAEGTTELFLYLILYANINSRYANNESVIEGYKAKIDSADLTAEEKDNIKAMLDAFLKGDISGLVSKLAELFAYNIQQTPNDFLNMIYNAIASFFKKIVDYFDNLFKILSGEKEPPRWDLQN